ncbi:hypothetical protein [Actinoplanes sp. TFC3]|uniref:hypothetical protein n=1 Tax=Actinoplanes sp. TFC3 TaxID=1710355 RepID=UPI00128FF603|nr:hypothetical protein [Actinoplanes sp. TFC3]
MIAMVMGGFLLGAAVVTTGTANAGQIEGAGRQVVFAGGGMLDFSCRSNPSIESMTVPAESTVRLINRTGRDAKLMLNGDNQGAVADDSSTEVVFRRGTTAVALRPACAMATESAPVLVTATPSTTPDPATDPDGEEESPGDGSTSPSEPGPGTPPVSDSQGPPPTTTQPVPATPTQSQSPAPGPVGVTRTAAPSVPLGGSTPHVNGRAANGTEGSNVPALTQLPVGQDKMLLDPVRAEEGPVTATEPAPVQEAEPTSDIAAAEPVAAMAPMPKSQPIGLLAIIATVCALGVGVGAIRAFVSQRASVANLA